MVAFAAVQQQSLLVQDACAHDQMMCLSTAQLQEASQVCNAVGFLSVPSLLQAQREDCKVQEHSHLLDCWSLTFLAELFSTCASHNDYGSRDIYVYYHKEAGRRTAAPERSFLVSE
jgi:hypothetical protein